MGQSAVNFGVRLADHSAHGALEEILLCVGSPGGRNGAVAAAHRGFEALVLNLLAQVVGEGGPEALVDEADVGEAEGEANVLVELDELLNGHEDGLEGVLNDVLAHLAAGGDRHGVGIDHAVTLLEDALLGVGRSDFFLALVADQVGLQILVNDEARTKSVNVLALSTLGENVGFRVDLATGNLRELSGDIKGESTEVADVDRLALTKVLIEVSSKSFPDNKHLSLLLNRFLVAVGAFSGSVVHARESGTLSDNPIANILNFHASSALVGVNHALHHFVLLILIV